MSPYQGVRATSAGIGQANPSHVDGRKPYRWRGNPGWEPGDPRFREDALIGRSGAQASTALRQQRLVRFAAALAELGEPDPARAPNPAVIEAGRRVGVGGKTAIGYRTALRKQQQGATS
jgi:hypothetical protein